MSAIYKADLCLDDFPTLIRYVGASERQFEGLVDEAIAGPSADPSIGPELSPEQTLKRLRYYRAVHSTALLWQDLNGEIDLETMGHQLSSLARRCLSEALIDSQRALEALQGTLLGVDGEPLGLSILGMGKLGGDELNFNSDIDIVFTYRSAGTAQGRRQLDAGQYLTQVARGLIQRLDQVTVHGRVWAVDTRLRPFGQAGALVWSVSALETYIVSEGRTWERYAWLKASHAAGEQPTSQAVLATLRPFIYRRYRDYGIFDSLRSLHAKIDGQAKRFGAHQDIKRGSGGIRALEFLVQSLQLLEGGRISAMQQPGFYPALHALLEHQLIDSATHQAMDQSYRFLRTLENRLQAMMGQQTHILPTEPGQRALLARLMGCPDTTTFDEMLTHHQQWVHQQFSERFLESSPHTARQQPSKLHWPPTKEAIDQLISQGLSSEAAQALYEALDQLAQRLAKKPMSGEGRLRLERLMPLLISELVQHSDPMAGAPDLLRLIETIAQRSAYLALLYERNDILTRVVVVFLSSAQVARWVIESPQLLDDLIDPAHQNTQPPAPILQASDPEQGLNALGRWRQARFLKIALAELNRDITPVVAGHALSRVAEATLQTILAGIDPHSPLAVIAYGNLGSESLHYASDLDCVFLHACQAPDHGMARTAQRMITMMQLPLPGGRLFEVDTRLRPNGRAGLLVSHIDQFAAYQHNEAWLWEHQALIRARWVAGDPAIATAFENIRQKVLRQPRDARETAETLWAMRQKQKSERQESTLKQRLNDIQFIGEWAVLTQATLIPELLQARGVDQQLAHMRGLTPTLAKALSEALEILLEAQHHAFLDRHPATLSDETLRRIDDSIQSAWQTLLA